MKNLPTIQSEFNHKKVILTSSSTAQEKSIIRPRSVPWHKFDLSSQQLV